MVNANKTIEAINKIYDIELADKDMIYQMNNILINKLNTICKKIDTLESNKENTDPEGTKKDRNKKFFKYCQSCR